MSNKDSDWDLEDEKEFGQELDQNTGQDDPYQDNMAGQQGFDTTAGSQDFDQSYNPGEEYVATPTDDPTQVTSDTSDAYQEYGTEEFSGDDSDFDDYDFMDETTPTSDAYTDGDDDLNDVPPCDNYSANGNGEHDFSDLNNDQSITLIDIIASNRSPYDYGTCSNGFSGSEEECCL